MSLTATRSVIGRWLLAGVLPLVLVAAAGAAETPTSSGEASRVEIPLFRIPFMKTPPKIDGIMEEGEWEDSSALSCFWYWAFPGGHYDFMAPFETQLQVYMAYDKDNLYMAWSSPVFPTGSWLRARGRFPKVIEHPLYGIYRDDYVGWGFRPYFDDVKTFRMGGFGWFVNPTSVVGDGGPAFEPDGGAKWKSDIVTRSNVTGSRWVQEMAIPLKNMVCGPYAGKDENGAEILSLPIADGTQWLFRLDRCSGEWGNRGFHNKFFDGTSRLIFDSSCVSVQVNELGPIMGTSSTSSSRSRTTPAAARRCNWASSSNRPRATSTPATPTSSSRTAWWNWCRAR